MKRLIKVFVRAVEVCIAFTAIGMAVKAMDKTERTKEEFDEFKKGMEE